MAWDDYNPSLTDFNRLGAHSESSACYNKPVGEEK